jgi:hypothetical protein
VPSSVKLIGTPLIVCVLLEELIITPELVLAIMLTF